MALTAVEVRAQYKVRHTGGKWGEEVIESPGKFEGEPTYVVSLWDMSLEQGYDEELPDSDTGGQTSIYAFFITADDRKEFPELKNVEVITLWETDNGFVHHKQFITKDAYERAKRLNEQSMEDLPNEEGDDLDGLAGCSGVNVCR